MLTNDQSHLASRPRPHPHDQTVLLPRTHAGTVVLPRVPREESSFADPSPAEDRPPARRIGFWKQFWLFAVPAVVAFALGWRGVADRDLWNDEYATYHAATLGWEDLFRLLDHVDRVLTLYYVLMHLWVSVAGDSIAMLRLPSVAAMSCAAGFTALVGQRLLNSNAGLIAGLIFAVIPATTRYAQEARSYAFAVAAATLATWLLMIALERPVWGYWLLYAGSVALTAAFHLISVLIVFPHVMLTWYRYQKSDRDVRLWKAIGALALIAALTMPMAFAGSSQDAAIEWIRADKHAIIQFPKGLFGSYPAATALAAMALMAALVMPFARRRRLTLVLLVWTIVPAIFTYLTHSVLHAFLFRYLLFTLPGWALLAAGGIHAVVRLMSRLSWPQLPIGAAVLAVIVLLTLPAQSALREPVLPGESDFAGAARAVASGVQPGDGLAYGGNIRALRRAMEYEMRTDRTWPDDIFLVKSPAQRGDFGAQECTKTLPCVGTRKRIWLVSSSYSDDPWTEMPGERVDTLSRLFKVSKDWQFQRIHVYLLVRKALR
jgi:mannosyltransferase